MFQALVNKKTFAVESADDVFKINSESVVWDFAEVSEGYFHILFNDKSYRAEVVKADYQAKTFTLKINNTLCTVDVKDRFDLLLEKMGMNSSASAKVNSIKAPMPGLIIDLKIKVGDTVKAGDPLLILEAMKMENIIKSPGEGIVKTVKIKKGDSVEKNQVLIEF
jgi:biotin carboxyl carrier protein